MKKLKVYHITLMGRYPCIVAAPSMRAAAEKIGTTYHDMRTYGSETGNDAQIALAMSKPGTVFWAPRTAYMARIEDYSERRPF